MGDIDLQGWVILPLLYARLMLGFFSSISGARKVIESIGGYVSVGKEKQTLIFPPRGCNDVWMMTGYL